MFRKVSTFASVLMAAFGSLALPGCSDPGDPPKADSVKHEPAKPGTATHEPAKAETPAMESGAGNKPISVLPETSVDLGNGIQLVMVLIPAGEFMMGDDNGEKNEKPAHKVSITKPFYLGKYLVTQEQWQAVMGNNPSHFKGANPEEQVARNNCPVEEVKKWNDCQVFLDKLNAKVGGKGGKFVLPTEAQWEYACRAGSTTKFYFGDDKTQLGDYAWYVANAKGGPHPVGEKKPNAWGLYDMHGNVWEWCHDWIGPYEAIAATDPTGPASGSGRVLRGGTWSYPATFCHSACRYQLVGLRFVSIGLRVARIQGEK